MAAPQYQSRLASGQLAKIISPVVQQTSTKAGETYSLWHGALREIDRFLKTTTATPFDQDPLERLSYSQKHYDCMQLLFDRIPAPYHIFEHITPDINDKPVSSLVAQWAFQYIADLRNRNSKPASSHHEEAAAQLIAELDAQVKQESTAMHDNPPANPAPPQLLEVSTEGGNRTRNLSKARIKQLQDLATASNGGKNNLSKARKKRFRQLVAAIEGGDVVTQLTEGQKRQLRHVTASVEGGVRARRPIPLLKVQRMVLRASQIMKLKKLNRLRKRYPIVAAETEQETMEETVTKLGNIMHALDVKGLDAGDLGGRYRLAEEKIEEWTQVLSVIKSYRSKKPEFNLKQVVSALNTISNDFAAESEEVGNMGHKRLTQLIEKVEAKLAEAKLRLPKLLVRVNAPMTG